MYQLRTLWWRSHAHAPNSSRVPVTAMPTTARRTRANVPTDRITSVRFIVVARFIAILLFSVSSVDILQTSFIQCVCDIPAGPVACEKDLSMAYLFPARAASASRWTSSVLALRRDFRQRIGDDLCSWRRLPRGIRILRVEPPNCRPDSGIPRPVDGAYRDARTPRKRGFQGRLAERLSAGAFPRHCDSARSHTPGSEPRSGGRWMTTRPLRNWGRRGSEIRMLELRV